MKKCGIYQIINILNGKSYIGSSYQINKRWNQHKLNLKNKTHVNNYLQNAWNLYGADNFDFIILEECEREILIEREEFYFNNKKPEYNLTLLANGRQVISESHRQKIIHYNKTREFTDEMKKKISLARTGTKSSEETKKKISIAGKGRKFSKEHIRKLTENSYVRKHPEIVRGENHPLARLTWEQVREMRQLFKDGFTRSKLREKFNATKAMVEFIIAGKTWKEND